MLFMRSTGGGVTRASFELIANVPVESLLLDVSNARIRSGQDQPDCIARLIRKEAQFLALAKSIAEEGLSTAPILVQPSGRSYIVWDGNRRVAALKLLNKPQLCPVAHLRRKLEHLREIHRATIPANIDVQASSDVNALVAEVLRRHAGEMGGAGQMDWSAFLRSVFLTSHKRQDANRRAALLFLWAEEHGVEVADEIKVTSLTRFLTLDNLKSLGFSISKDGVVSPLIEIGMAVGVVERLASDFSPTGKVGVDQVFTPDAAKRYVAGILEDVGLTPDEGSAEEAEAGRKPGSTGRKGTEGEQPDEDGTGDAQPRRRKPARPTRESWDRSRLLSRKGGPTFDVPKTETKAHNIVVELGKLNPNEVPLAVAALLRMLIEFSEMHYRRRYKGIPTAKDKKGNLRCSAEHMLARGSIDEGDYANFIRYFKEAGSLLHYDTLNAYLHASKAHPVGQTLCQFYDDIEPFVRACWS